MAKVTITINNRTITCQEGETIVDVARENGIFIPTICYLGGCSPTLACKMCMGESDDGKRVYTCNTKAKDGLVINTETEQIRKERQMIMQTYDVNHPLECGVCDKSGECELQNLTLYTKVAHQDYALADDEKHEKSWAQALYDPNLCIVCERCVTTCKDNIGEAKLKAGKADLHSPDSYKDSMLKDPYSVWSKKQKSLIEFVSDTPCVDCGECISVCPVGALTYKDFSYTANAWELRKTNSTCHYCSMGCHITYETRHHNTLGEKKTYRVSNDFHFAPICGAGRFGFSVLSAGVESNVAKLDSSETSPYFKHLGKATAMRLGSSITNEEAMIVSIFSAHFGIKLYNESARAYQKFLPYLRLNNTLQDLKDSSTIIALGAPVRLQAPLLQYAINNTIRTKKGIKFYYLHPIADTLLASFSRSVTHIPYKPKADELALGALLISMQNKLEEAIAQSPQAKELGAMLSTLLSGILASEQPPAKLESSADLDSSVDSSSAQSAMPIYLALQEAGIELSALSELASVDLSQMSVIVGEEAMLCALQENSAMVAGLQILEKCGARVYVIPAGSNTAGIARICGELLELDSSSLDSSLESQSRDEFVIGVRAQGDVLWDCAWSDGARMLAGEPEVVLPSHQQMLGSMTNFENRLLPFAKVQAYQGDDLASILYAYNKARLEVVHYEKELERFTPSTQDNTSALLDYFSTYTALSDYTKALPQSKGYAPKELASLANHYTQGGDDKRGYMLAPLLSGALAPAHTIVQVKPISFNAFISYPQNLFSIQNVLDSNMQQKDGFYTSKAHLEKLGLTEGEYITLHRPSAQGSITGAVYIDYAMSEDMWLISPHIAREWGENIASSYTYVESAKATKE